jgi:biopolymer transport protein TolQ
MANSLDILHIVAEASHMVQLVLLLLLFFSLTSWTIILIKFLYMRRAFRQSEAFSSIFWESRDLSLAYKEANLLDGSPIARLFSIGYAELKKLRQSGSKSMPDEDDSLIEKFTGIDNVKRSLRRAITTETTRMTQMIPFLATAGNTTPFIGLFGTVWGIMESFRNIGLSGTASLAVVAPGISEALVATAAGLAVAIPAVIAFNYFMQRIRVMESELQIFAADFLNIIEMDILPAKGKR